MKTAVPAIDGTLIKTKCETKTRSKIITINKKTKTMGRVKGDPVNADLEDIEIGTPKQHCFNCRQKQRKCVLVLEGHRKTQTFMPVCLNKNCFRYTNTEKLETWVLIPT